MTAQGSVTGVAPVTVKRKVDRLFTPAKRRPFRGTVIVAACSALMFAACSSSASNKATTTTPPSSTQNASPTTGSPVTSATSGSTSLKKCPTAAMVSAALGQHDSGPAVSGTAVYEICTYKGSGVVPTKVTISVGTAAEFRGE